MIVSKIICMNTYNQTIILAIMHNYIPPKDWWRSYHATPLSCHFLVYLFLLMSYFRLHKCLPSTFILWCKLDFESGVNMCLSKYSYLYFIWFNLRYYTVLAYLDVWGLRMITCSIVLGAYNWRLCLFFDFSEIKCLWCKILRLLLRLEIFGDFTLFLYAHHQLY